MPTKPTGTTTTSPTTTAPAPAPDAGTTVAVAPSPNVLASGAIRQVLAAQDWRWKKFPIPEDDKTLPAFPGGGTYQTLVMFPASSVVNGILQANANTIYAGTTKDLLPYKRQATDLDYPIIFGNDPGKVFRLEDIFVQGKAGDGVFVIYY